MLKDHKCRMLLTAFGGLAMLAGGGTASAAMAAEFRAVLTGDNELATGDAAGEDGSPVVKLDTPDDNDSDDCDNIGDALADDIQANPGEFYVSVQTAEHPAGAIRGQLVPNSD